MRLFNKTGLWRGLTAVFACILAACIAGTVIAMTYSIYVNQFFNAQTSEIINVGDTEQDTEYYKSDYDSADAVRAAAEQHVITEQEEGTVLLMNNNALPLAADERDITLFGNGAAFPMYTGNSAGSGTQKDPDRVTDLREAFDNAGFNVNDTLFDAYIADGSTRSSNTSGPMDYFETYPIIGEKPQSFYTDELRASWADNYNDVAVVVFTREAREGTDIKTKAIDNDNVTPISQLALYQDEKALLRMVADSGFGKTIVLINSVYQMELGWLDEEEYGIDACLWIGDPGLTGFTGVVNILTGEVNPSGRLVDTWAANSLSSPAVVNAIENTPSWTNYAEIDAITGATRNDIYNLPCHYDYYTVQLEGIYFGYKYYETRYEDAVLGRYGAVSTAGASYEGNWNYADEMVFPFGYGLSYTEFSQEITGVEFNPETDTYEVGIKVTNTGDVAGKLSVPVYAQTPYGEYERTNLVEKSAIQLVGFGKTKLLNKNESDEFTVSVDRYLLASYDYKNAEGYILSEGDYYFAIGTDVHDALNNILYAKGATGMVDHNGNAFSSGDAENSVYTFHYDNVDTETYRYSEETDRVVTNLFDEGDINYWLEKNGKQSVKYLTRQDWDDTYPVCVDNLEATDDMFDAIINNKYEKPDNAPSVDEFTQEADNGITFIMMKDVSYDDNEMWNRYLDQFSVAELALSVTGGGIPANTDLVQPEADGADGIQGPVDVVYSAPAVIAATFNRELMQKRGDLIGEEALYDKKFENYGLGGNMHRTPFGGRNFEYVSEDANLCAFTNYEIAASMKNKGFIPSIKHFAVHDQESWRVGLSQFFTEQSLRESQLRAFEGTLRWAGSNGLMGTSSRIGIEYTPDCDALMTGLLRNEWGFKGKAETDAARCNVQTNWPTQIASGTTNFCHVWVDSVTGYSTAGKALTDLVEGGDGSVLQNLRNVTKEVHYALLHSNAINGLSSDSVIVPITPWWQIVMFVMIAVAAVLLAGCTAMLCVSEIKNRKDRSTK